MQTVAFTDPFVEVDVGDGKRKFYPLSIRTAFRLRAVGKPLARAFASLFSGVGQETGRVKRVRSDGGSFEREVVHTAIDPKLAEVKLAARERTMNDLIDAITDPANGEVLAAVVMDSMRDDYPRKPSKADIDAFIDRTSIVQAKALLLGVAEANKDVFGPLAARLSASAPNADSPVNDPVASEKPTPS